MYVFFFERSCGLVSQAVAALRAYGIAFAEERAWVRTQIDKLEQFIDWYDHLENVAQDNAEAAQRQRLTFDACITSVLAPCCRYLDALFSPDRGFAPTKHYDFRNKADLCFVPPLSD